MQNKEFVLKSWKGEKSVLDSYARLLSQVYNKTVEPSHLYWKHLNNPVGHSLITYAENAAGEMVAARAFWPMYSEGDPIFQPCDTVTRPDYQRLGLFSKLTKMCLEALPENAAVINFPNTNSFPGYIKLGWKLLEPNLRVFAFRLPIGIKSIPNLKEVLQEKVTPKKSEYLEWRFSKKSGVQYTFGLTSKGIVVSNGKSQGYVSFAKQDYPYSSGLWKSEGYVLPSAYSKVSGFLSGAVALKCQSRTVFYLKEQATIDTLKASLKQAQVNILMDTF